MTFTNKKKKAINNLREVNKYYLYCFDIIIFLFLAEKIYKYDIYSIRYLLLKAYSLNNEEIIILMLAKDCP